MLWFFSEFLVALFFSQNGVMSSLPFLLMWLTAIMAGWLSDYLVARNVFSVTVIRKVFTTIGK